MTMPIISLDDLARKELPQFSLDRDDVFNFLPYVLLVQQMQSMIAAAVVVTLVMAPLLASAQQAVGAKIVSCSG